MYPQFMYKLHARDETKKTKPNMIIFVSEDALSRSASAKMQPAKGKKKKVLSHHDWAKCICEERLPAVHHAASISSGSRARCLGGR